MIKEGITQAALTLPKTRKSHAPAPVPGAGLVSALVPDDILAAVLGGDLHPDVGHGAGLLQEVDRAQDVQGLGQEEARPDVQGEGLDEVALVLEVAQGEVNAVGDLGVIPEVIEIKDQGLSPQRENDQLTVLRVAAVTHVL
jgi:hypothetical protein